jgi:short-subunit dehydrogenase
MSEWTGVHGKRVVITGATKGIGLAAAQELAKRGAQLAIVARNESTLRQATVAAVDVATATCTGQGAHPAGLSYPRPRI